MIFCLTRPEASTRSEYLARMVDAPFSYAEVGATADGALVELAARYNVDRYEADLGAGLACFERAKQGLSRWAHFDLGWLNIASPPPVQGLTVAVVHCAFGLMWTLHFCRVVYVLDDPQQPHCWGFAYGTLGAHGERGEERFVLRYDPTTDRVSYEIVAFSRPKHWLAILAYPLTRMWQRRFGRQSLARMRQWVQFHS